MEIITKSAFQVLPFSGRINFPGNSLTILIKATFDISHKAIAKLAEDQLPATADEYYPDDESQTGTLYYSSDFAYFKPAADMLVSAKCHVPNGHPVSACPVSIQIGDYKKILSVHGSRYWKNIYLSPKTTDPELFTEMDMRYERSFGGADYALNPIGRGAVKEDITVADNVLPVPNIQDPKNLANSPFVKTLPAGFSPIPSTWSQRHEKLGTYDKKYLKNRWPWFPEDFSWSHFNAAPRDQQIKDYLHGDEKLRFENLHRKFSVFETQLPGIRPRCFTRKQNPETGKRYFDEVNLKLDTLWVDLEKEKLVLTWRGWTDVLDEEFDEVRQIFLMEESMQEKPAQIEFCYDRFKEAQAAEEAEFSNIPEEPPLADAPARIKMPTVKAPGKTLSTGALADSGLPLATAVVTGTVGGAVTGKEDDKVSLKNQMDELMAQAGISTDKIAPELQQEFQVQQEKLALSSAEQENENKQQLSAAMSSMGLDVNSLPELTPKAKQEKIRFFKELGINSTDMEASEALNQVWAALVVALPKMGIDPEDLTPLIEQNREQIKKIKADIFPITDATKEKPVKKKVTEETAAPQEEKLIPGTSFVGQDLSGKDFSGMDLSSCDFSFCVLTKTNFSQANLQSANFQQSNLSGANFSQANLDMANFSHADAKATVFESANCDNTILDNANFESVHGGNSSWKNAYGKDAIFVKGNLESANFSEANIEGADFESSILTGTNFSMAKLQNATFEKVKAEGSIFFKADITGLRASQNANFSKSNFSQVAGESPVFLAASFEEADLTYCDMPGASFTRANFKNANLSAGNFKQAHFIKANLAGAKFIKANLMQASVERANLMQADLRGSNCFEAEFLGAALDGVQLDAANLTGSKLAGSN